MSPAIQKRSKSNFSNCILTII